MVRLIIVCGIGIGMPHTADAKALGRQISFECFSAHRGRAWLEGGTELRISVVSITAAALSCGISSAAFSADDQPATGTPFVFYGGVGVIDLKTNSYAYDGGVKASQLIVESTSPVLTGGFSGRFGNGWTLAVEGAVAFDGSSKLANYGWDPAFSASDWTHYSHTAETQLDHYFSGSVAIGRDFEVDEQLTFNLNGGLKYTDVKWSGSGGSFVYSDGGFRDNVGDFSDGQRIISYRQQYPLAFAGIDLKAVHERWTFNLSAKGGLTFNASETDSRWRIGTRHETDFSSAPVLMLGARVDYALTDRSGIFLAGSYDRIFRAGGDQREYDIASGALAAEYPDGGGVDFRSATLTIGFKAAF